MTVKNHVSEVKKKNTYDRFFHCWYVNVHLIQRKGVVFINIQNTLSWDNYGLVSKRFLTVDRVSMSIIYYLLLNLPSNHLNDMEIGCNLHLYVNQNQDFWVLTMATETLSNRISMIETTCCIFTLPAELLSWTCCCPLPACSSRAGGRWKSRQDSYKKIRLKRLKRNITNSCQ